jgi:hypothetical protein
MNDCYINEGDGEIALGNARIEIRIDRRTGAVIGLRNKLANVAYLGRGTPEVFRIETCTWEIHGAQRGDPWSAVNGTLAISSKQHVSSTHFELTNDGARLVVGYDHLRLERRTIPVAGNTASN